MNVLDASIISEFGAGVAILVSIYNFFMHRNNRIASLETRVAVLEEKNNSLLCDVEHKLDKILEIYNK